MIPLRLEGLATFRAASCHGLRFGLREGLFLPLSGSVRATGTLPTGRPEEPASAPRAVAAYSIAWTAAASWSGAVWA
jgi:hypothetical protein